MRHAQAVTPWLHGPDDLHRPLTGAGHDAAGRLAAELAALAPTAIVSSPYLRAVQTVRPAARLAGLAVETRWVLREWDSGIEARPDYADHYARSWLDPDLVRPGGESLRQLTERAVCATRRLAVEHEGVVLVGTHGTFLSRLLLAHGHDMDWPASRAMPMPAVYRLRP